MTDPSTYHHDASAAGPAGAGRSKRSGPEIGSITERFSAPWGA
ncbi:hypothetical protein AB8841_12670 [Microvirga sp. TS319]